MYDGNDKNWGKIIKYYIRENDFFFLMYLLFRMYFIELG